MSDEEFQITGDETKKLAEALKKEEFRKLLVEYANEISDPENKKRYEEEITQLEKERGYNVKFLNPTPGFVVKTKFKNGGKVFINIATNSEIQPPTPGPLEILPSGQVGKNWSMPYSLVPAREGVDTNKQECTIYDCIFHPKSFEQAEANPKFKEMLVTTALDGIENELNASLERKSLKFPKSSYKGTPSASVIRKPNEKEKEEFDKKVKTDPIQQLLSNKPVEDPKPARDPTLPEYTIKYRGYFDMQDYTVNIPESKGKPKEIVISVMLPKLETIRDLELDVQEKAVMLYHNSPRYKLEIPLSFAVSIKEAQAKFIRDVRQLELVLPIIHKPPLALPPREIPDTIPCMGSNSTVQNESVSEGTSPDNEMVEVSLKLSENALQTCNYDSDDVTSDGNLGPLVSERTGPIESSGMLTSDETTIEGSDRTIKAASKLPPLEYRQTFKQIYFSFRAPDYIPETVATVFRCNEVELCFETYSLSYHIDIRLPTECTIKGSTSECRLTSNGIVLKLDKLGAGNRMWDTFRIGCIGGKLEERKLLTEASILREVEQVGDIWSEDNASLPMSIKVNKEDAPLFIELDMKETEQTANNEHTNTESLLQQGSSIEGSDITTNETIAEHDVTGNEPKTEAPGALLATLANDLIYELND